MKRIFDIILACLLGLTIFPIAIVISALIKLESNGPLIHWSARVGRKNKIFYMPKFRTMKEGTPIMPTHLMKDSRRHITFFGSYFRRFSLDELPQLWSILKGDMSFVGPRPALCSQDDLVLLRDEHGINLLVPGLTGWAQVNGRDELSIPDKVQYDLEYLRNQSFIFDMKILYLTFFKVIRMTGISH